MTNNQYKRHIRVAIISYNSDLNYIEKVSEQTLLISDNNEKSGLYNSINQNFNRHVINDFKIEDLYKVDIEMTIDKDDNLSYETKMVLENIEYIRISESKEKMMELVDSFKVKICEKLNNLTVISNKTKELIEINKLEKAIIYKYELKNKYIEESEYRYAHNYNISEYHTTLAKEDTKNNEIKNYKIIDSISNIEELKKEMILDKNSINTIGKTFSCEDENNNRAYIFITLMHNQYEHGDINKNVFKYVKDNEIEIRNQERIRMCLR